MPRRRPPFATEGIRGWSHLSWQLPDGIDRCATGTAIRTWADANDIEIEFEVLPDGTEGRIDVALEGALSQALMSAWPGFRPTGTSWRHVTLGT